MLVPIGTAAYTTQEFRMSPEQTLSVRWDDALAFTETITIEIPDGASGYNALSEGGTAVTITATNMQYSPDSYVIVRVNKPVTVNPVGVDIVTRHSI